MSDTWAVPTDFLAQANMSADSGQPLCPGCNGGRLHPYKVTIGLEGLNPEGNRAPYGGWHGVDYLEGWVAVCVGNAAANRKLSERYAALDEEPPVDPEVPACGFSMPMTPHRRHGSVGPSA
jgi:hypothetical protein